LTPAAHAKKPKPKKPKIFRHADVRAEATSPRGAVVTYLRARVQNARSVTYSKASGTLFPLGTTVVTITARNRAGAVRSTFKVTVVDTTAPTLAPIADITAKAGTAAGTPVTYGPVSATDTVDQSVAISCSPPSGSVFPVGTTSVNCTARDGAGNTATMSFHVVVVANGPPRFPNPMQIQTTTNYQYDDLGRLMGATTTITVSAAADPDGDPVTYSWSATNGSITGNGTSATWNRVISYGRVASGSVTVTATDGQGGSDTFTINFV
jgi:hypothetical protein